MKCGILEDYRHHDGCGTDYGSKKSKADEATWLESVRVLRLATMQQHFSNIHYTAPPYADNHVNTAMQQSSFYGLAVSDCIVVYTQILHFKILYCAW